MECLGKVLCCFGGDSGADAKDQSTDQITDLADGNKQIERDPGADAEDQSTDQIEELVDGHVFVLHKPAQSEEANVDIVFFHGLQLASYKRAYRETWESSVGREGKKILWPKEWLGKEDFPNARILSVSYDSSATGSVGSGREGMIGVAQGILMNLVTFCGVGKRRPVILVGHSLGGLVIKMMCVEAHRRLPEYQSFVESILGVFFYATPHGGAKLADDVCKKLRNFIRIAPALQYLASIDDSHLTMLSQDFKRAYEYHKWKAFIASEVQPIKFGPFGVLVVDSTSANHDIFNDTKSFRDTDHFSICKPKSKTDQPYLWLKTHIDKLKGEDEIADIDSAYRAVREIRQNGGRTMEALEFIHTAKREIDNKLLVITRLLDLQIIPSLVPLLKSADAPERQAAAGWALDTILYHGGEGANQEAAGVVDGAVVNALVGMLNDAVTAFPAVFCLRQLTGSNEKNRRDLAAHESTAKKLLEGLYMSPPKDQKHISEAAEEVLKIMNWMPLQGEQPSGAAVAAAASSSSTPVIMNYDTAPGKDA